MESKVGLVVCGSIAVLSIAIVAVIARRSVMRWWKWMRVEALLEEFEAQCDLTESKLKEIAEAIAVEMQAGLASESGSTIKMIPSYIYKLPQSPRIRTGYFYGLDFGGTHYRVMKIQIRGGLPRGIISQGQIHLIPDVVKQGTSDEVFDFIAFVLKNFIETEGEIPSNFRLKKRLLGFSFSFPVKQRTVSTGNLIKWTKQFTVQDGVDIDVADCLQRAMENVGLRIKVGALVNDAVSVLCFRHYKNKEAVAAVVIGTGTNASYMEKVSSIIHLPRRTFATPEEMAVNVEWGNFYSVHLPKSSYDVSLDAESSNPNEQGFEKMISGLYLGEIVRRVVHRMLKVLDEKLISNRLSTPYALSCESVAEIHHDRSPNLDNVARVLRDIFEMSEVTLDFRRVVVNVCDIVARRSACLAAAGIVGILKKLRRNESRETPRRKAVIIVDGALYNAYSLFRLYLNNAVSVIARGQEVSPYMIDGCDEDGPAVGATLVVASR